MAKFSYNARSKEGKRETGVLDASNQDEIVSRLQAQGLTIISVTALDKAPVLKREAESVGARRKFTHYNIRLYDLVFFARQLATLLDSDVNLHKSLDALLKQIDSTLLHKVISAVKKDVGGGMSLRDALAKHPRVFSELWVNIVESGEASGNLPLVLDRLAQYLEMQASFRRKIVSALVYPALLFFVAIGAIVFFMVKIVPTFTQLFEGFGVELPALTRALMQASILVKRGFLPALITIVIVYFLFQQASRTYLGRRAIDIFKLRLPVFGNFFKVLAVERFTSQMATLIEGGVPILYALEITERSGGNKVLEGVVREIKTKVREGRPLGELMAQSNFFEPMVVQMIYVGEEVGELAKMFKRVAKFYDEYLEMFVGRFATMFEPIMLVFMGGIIGTMVIALFLPIFSIASAGGSGSSGLKF